MLSAIDRDLARADRLRHVHGDRRAAAAVTEVGEQLRRQLRLGDHPPDVLHQRDPLPAAPQERRLDAEDAGDSAEVKAIQDRYKNLKATDPAKQKMNTEMMALYKEKGVNPASGCVPMLLTMPFIFAFYALLSTAIELRGAPFIFWIHDLSAHDPYFVTPILMGISQIWQQRLAPAAGMDPIQQKMTMLMPVFFTFLFLWYPAGVALYWLINNVFAIGQQYTTNYMIGPPKIARRVDRRVGDRAADEAGRRRQDRRGRARQLQ